MNHKKLLYNYTVIDISEGDEIGFTAVIPKFPKLHIVSDSISELHDVVQTMVKEEIEFYQEKGLPIPKPDAKNYSGRFILRVRPEIHEKLDQLSNAEGTSLNQYLNRLIEERVG